MKDFIGSPSGSVHNTPYSPSCIRLYLLYLFIPASNIWNVLKSNWKQRQSKMFFWLSIAEWGWPKMDSDIYIETTIWFEATANQLKAPLFCWLALTFVSQPWEELWATTMPTAGKRRLLSEKNPTAPSAVCSQPRLTMNELICSLLKITWRRTGTVGIMFRRQRRPNTEIFWFKAKKRSVWTKEALRPSRRNSSQMRDPKRQKWFWHVLLLMK